MHTHRTHLVDGFPGYPRVKGSGWFFGTTGPAVAHTPDWLPRGAWRWFITADFAVVRADFQIEPVR